jgi:hypothetical protein
MKTCSRCLVEKPLNEYPLRGGGRKGVRAHCKSCASELTLEWRGA